MIVPIKAANTSIMGKCHSTVLGLYKMQHPNLLTLSWRSLDTLLTFIFGWSDIEINDLACEGHQYFDYRQIP